MSGFNLRSGNAAPFKLMGSSPAKQEENKNITRKDVRTAKKEGRKKRRQQKRAEKIERADRDIRSVSKKNQPKKPKRSLNEDIAKLNKFLYGDSEQSTQQSKEPTEKETKVEPTAKKKETNLSKKYKRLTDISLDAKDKDKFDKGPSGTNWSAANR